MNTKEFKEAIYELAFGDNAINKDFSEEEVVTTIKGFAQDSWVAKEQAENLTSHCEVWSELKLACQDLEKRK
jgi:hypothetical protein|tara:strand:- start:181 stop:396 length:216 start_codon:yes stop_codon:yes gene_type:complete